jgi:DNA-binding NarL/FixJ family response regulator
MQARYEGDGPLVSNLAGLNREQSNRMALRESKSLGTSGQSGIAPVGPPAGMGQPSAESGAGARVRLLVVDDHQILREGLRALLELQPDMEVIGEAGNFEQALKLATEHMPDIVLTDIGLPGRSGLLLARELRLVCPGSHTILLTAHSSEEYIRAGLEAQADGYVLKDSGHAELITAIRAVARGQHFLCKAVAARVLASYANGPQRPAASDPLRQVTSRERQVLTRIAFGHTNKVVARELNLSVKTVEKHRANLMRKLLLHNAADITRFALLHHMMGGEQGDGTPYLVGEPSGGTTAA